MWYMHGKSNSKPFILILQNDAAWRHLNEVVRLFHISLPAFGAAFAAVVGGAAAAQEAFPLNCFFFICTSYSHLL